MIKYKTGDISHIEEVIVSRETAKHVFIRNFRGVVHKYPTRGEQFSYFDTWDEAKAFLAETAQKEYEEAKQRLEDAERYLASVTNLSRTGGHE